MVASILLFGLAGNGAHAEGLAPLGRPESPAETWELGYVGFREMIELDSNGRRTWSAYRGKYRQTLDGADFYEAVDRPDLASAYRRRHTTKLTLVTGGIAVSAVGLLLAVRGRSTGDLLLAGGLVPVGVSFLIDLDPVGETEARMLADQHNKALRRALTAPPPEVHNVLSWQVAPLVGPSAGGVTLSASF
jgi:hypothetical protein